MPRQDNTKDLFLYEALKLFGERGFDSVKISEIAGAVGCVPSALYRHYENKQQLYDAILEESYKGYEAAMGRINNEFGKYPEERGKYFSMTEEDQIRQLQKLLAHTIHDEWAKAFRKLMMVEQFHRPELAEMYDKRYISAQYQQFAVLFAMLMEAGKMRQADPYDLAVMYASPLIVMVGICDRNPDKEEWAMERLACHVREFNRSYRI